MYFSAGTLGVGNDNANRSVWVRSGRDHRGGRTHTCRAMPLRLLSEANGRPLFRPQRTGLRRTSSQSTARRTVTTAWKSTESNTAVPVPGKWNQLPLLPDMRLDPLLRLASSRAKQSGLSPSASGTSSTQGSQCRRSSSPRRLATTRSRRFPVPTSFRPGAGRRSKSSLATRRTDFRPCILIVHGAPWGATDRRMYAPFWRDRSSARRRTVRRIWARARGEEPTEIAPLGAKPSRPEGNPAGASTQLRMRQGDGAVHVCAAFGRLRLDENYQSLGQNAVMLHGLRRRFALHRAREGIHVSDIHEHGHVGRVLRVDKCPYIGDTEGTEELFALWRGKPMVFVSHIVVADYCRHGSPFGPGVGGSGHAVTLHRHPAHTRS